MRCWTLWTLTTFQLTHLLRGATSAISSPISLYHFNSRTSCEVRPRFRTKLDGMGYFNSRTSCEVRHKILASIINSRKISTHAPLARCDGEGRSSGAPRHKFQLTHLLRGATLGTAAPLANLTYFNSRTSCEVRHKILFIGDSFLDFNSRTSCEVRQTAIENMLTVSSISTHAPLARCDVCGSNTWYIHNISTHAPLARCDEKHVEDVDTSLISTHAPLARCDMPHSPAW